MAAQTIACAIVASLLLGITKRFQYKKRQTLSWRGDEEKRNILRHADANK